MNRLSDAHHFRKQVAGICMLVAPALLLAGVIFHPETGTSESSIVAAAAADPDGWYAAHMFMLASLVLAVPAVLGLMHMLREREAAWGHVGGGLALLGVIAYVGIVSVEGFVGWQAGAGNSAEMTALFERLFDSTGFGTVFTVASLGFVLGMVTLAMGLYRARATQSYYALFIAAAAVMISISGSTASELVGVIGAAFLLVGLGMVGRTVLAETDEEWEHTPEYTGFRSLAGMR
jgi:hypothetical protein